MAVVYVFAVYRVYQASAASTSIFHELPLAWAMALVPCALLAALSVAAMIAKSIRYISRLSAVRVSPEIRELLADVAVGGGDRKRLRWLAEHHYKAFEVILTEFLSSFGGGIKSELSTLAIEFGFAQRWRRETLSRNFLTQKRALANLGRIGYAIDSGLLRHPLEQTRIEAACALLASGSIDAPALVFKMLPEQSLLGRIRLADSLRPFATEICEKYLIDGMRSSDVRRARASVDLLRAWERWIPIDSFAALMAEGDMSTRLAALPALRYASATEEEATHEVLNLLSAPDEHVRATAAKAAADIGVSASIPLLINQLRTDGPVSALAAATALARLGSTGIDLLEKEVFSSTRPQYALQALERSLLAERG
jgi:HEAT repeat protein